jgi:hypothetical protein
VKKALALLRVPAPNLPLQQQSPKLMLRAVQLLLSPVT